MATKKSPQEPTSNPVESKEAEKIVENITPKSREEVLEDRVNKLEGMLRHVADKGRLEKYEEQNRGKTPMKVRVSKYGGGYIVGWRTVKDNLIKNPTTGRTVGEEQEFEVLILKEDSKVEKRVINGYPAFSDARYNDRVEVTVSNKATDWEGRATYTVSLPDGRDYQLAEQYIN